MESHFAEHCKLKVRIADCRFRVRFHFQISDFRLFQISDFARIALRFTICDLRSAICDLQSAICNLQSAICNLQSAICNLRSAICICNSEFVSLKAVQRTA